MNTMHISATRNCKLFKNAHFWCMNGPQLRKWRLDHDLTLREIAEKLDGLTHTTISRWENSKESIPTWASDKLLATTQITLPLDELHQLLDAARAEGKPAQEILDQAIREWLQKRQARSAPRKIESFSLNETPTQYTTGGGSSHGHDTIRHDAMPSQHAAQEHHEP